MYAAFTSKMLDYILGKEHPIAVAEFLSKDDHHQGRKNVYVVIVPGDAWFPRVIGRNGQTINLIENLLKMKGYLNNSWITVKVEN